MHNAQRFVHHLPNYLIPIHVSRRLLRTLLRVTYLRINFVPRMPEEGQTRSTLTMAEGQRN